MPSTSSCGSALAERRSTARIRASSSPKVEGLDDVVVRAGAQAADAVDPLVARGQADDRQLVAPCAHFTQHFGAVAVGQAKIQQHQARRPRARERERLGCRPRYAQAVAATAELQHEEARDLRIVFHHQDPFLHAGNLPEIERTRGKPIESTLKGSRPKLSFGMPRRE